MIKDVPHVSEALTQIYGCRYHLISWVAKMLPGNELKYLNSTFWKRKQDSELAFEWCTEYKPCCGLNRHKYYGMYPLQCIVLTAYPLESASVGSLLCRGFFLRCCLKGMKDWFGTVDGELKVKNKFCLLKHILVLNLIWGELTHIAQFRERKRKNLGNLIKMIGSVCRERREGQGKILLVQEG